MDEHLSLRQLAGTIVRDEMARKGMGRLVTAAAASISPSTLARVIIGDPKVGDLTLRQVEGALGLPRRLLTLVIEGDDQRLRELDMETDLRIYVLSSMTDIKNASSGDEKPRKSRRHG